MEVPQELVQLLKPVVVPPVGVVCIAAVQVKPVLATVEFRDIAVVKPGQMVCGLADPTGIGLMTTWVVAGSWYPPPPLKV